MARARKKINLANVPAKQDAVEAIAKKFSLRDFCIFNCDCRVEVLNH